MPKKSETSGPRKRHLFLVGFSGSGKSTVGPILARRLKQPFFDSDLEIEMKSGQSVAGLFAGGGERTFRSLELKTIRNLASRSVPSIIALGGGALLNRDTRTLVLNTGIVVYLRCSMREIQRRLSEQTDRPLLHSRQKSLHDRIRALYPLRKPGYEMADITVTTSSRSVSQTVIEILQKLRETSWR